MNRRRNGNGQFAEGEDHLIGRELFALRMPNFRTIVGLIIGMLFILPWLYFIWQSLNPRESFENYLKDSAVREAKNVACNAHKNGYDFCDNLPK
jgi:hypothetical protein